MWIKSVADTYEWRGSLIDIGLFTQRDANLSNSVADTYTEPLCWLKMARINIIPKVNIGMYFRYPIIKIRNNTNLIFKVRNKFKFRSESGPSPIYHKLYCISPVSMT